MKIAGKDIGVWAQKATPFEILSLAIRMEQGAAAGYRRLARSARTPPAQAKFRYLAEEEREHARLLAAARARLVRPTVGMALPLTAAEVSGAPEGESPVAAVRLALQAEKEANAFYLACARRCGKGAAGEMFRLLAAQERGHAAELSRELKQLAGPLPWSSLEGTVPEEKDYWS